jgi:hypothetical protein
MLKSSKSLYLIAAMLLSASSPALAETTYMSCKGGWNNPTWWGHAFLTLNKSDAGTSLDFSFDSKDRSFRSGSDDSEYALFKDGFSAKFNFRTVPLNDSANSYVWRRDESIVGRTGNKISSGVVAGGVIVMKERDEIAKISDYETISIDRTNLSLRYEMMDPTMQAQFKGIPRVSTFQCATVTKEVFLTTQHERLTKVWKKGIAPLIKARNDAEVKPGSLKI